MQTYATYSPQLPDQHTLARMCQLCIYAKILPPLYCHARTAPYRCATSKAHPKAVSSSHVATDVAASANEAVIIEAASAAASAATLLRKLWGASSHQLHLRQVTLRSVVSCKLSYFSCDDRRQKITSCIWPNILSRISSPGARTRVEPSKHHTMCR